MRKSNLQEGSMLEWLVFKTHHQCRPSNTQIKEESTRFKWPECRRTRDMPDAYSSCLPGPRHMLRLPLLCHLSPSPLHPQPWTTNSDFLCRRCVETCGSLRLLRVHGPNHQLSQCGDPNKTMQAHHVQWHHSSRRHQSLHFKSTCVITRHHDPSTSRAGMDRFERKQKVAHLYTWPKIMPLCTTRYVVNTKSPKKNRPLKLLLPHPLTLAPSACRSFACSYLTNKA